MSFTFTEADVAWLNNPWVIGIASGIVVWAVTWVISRMLLSKKENREYAQKLAAANREVIIAIRPGIAEGNVPTRDIVEAMVNATARKCAVTAADMYSPKELSEELVKEVMDSSFLSSSQKMEYCAKLQPIRVGGQPRVEETAAASAESKSATSKVAAAYRSRMVEMLSLMMSLSAGIMTALLAIPQIRKSFRWDILNKSEGFTILIPLVVTVTIVAVTYLFMELRELRRKESELKAVRGAVDAVRRVTESLKRPR